MRITVKDKAQHAVVMDKTIQERLNKDVLTYRLITTAVLVDRLKINGSLARKAIAELEEKGVIKKIVGHSKLSIYSEFPHTQGWTGLDTDCGHLARAVGDAQ
jgi:small subunit ribosomal protein S25e